MGTIHSGLCWLLADFYIKWPYWIQALGLCSQVGLYSYVTANTGLADVMHTQKEPFPIGRFFSALQQNRYTKEWQTNEQINSEKIAYLSFHPLFMLFFLL